MMTDIYNPLSTGLEQDATLFAAVGRRWCETSGHGRQTPLLDVGLDKNEAHLTQVHMHGTWAVGANGGEEVV